MYFGEKEQNITHVSQKARIIKGLYFYFTFTDVLIENKTIMLARIFRDSWHVTTGRRENPGNSKDILIHSHKNKNEDIRDTKL